MVKTRYNMKKIYNPLTICSYNVNLLFLDMYQNRIHDLVEEILECGADIVCLQECFQSEANRLFRKLLKKKYIYFCDDQLDIPFYNVNSGLFIASVYPLDNIYFETYRDSANVDSLSHKGFLSCRVVTPTHMISICNTHLQSDYIYGKYQEIREKQVCQLLAYLSNVNSSYILCGDWNIDRYSLEYRKVLYSLMSNHFPQIWEYKGNVKKNQRTHSDGYFDYFFLISRNKYDPYHRLKMFSNRKYTNSDHKLVKLT